MSFSRKGLTPSSSNDSLPLHGTHVPRIAMDPSEPFSALESRITSALVASTRITSQLCAEDIPFHRSLDPSIGTQIDRQNERLLALADRLLSSAAAGSDAVGHRDNHKSLLPDADALESNWRGVVDVLDSLLERADTSLDEFTGVVKRGVGTPLKEQVILGLLLSLNLVTNANGNCSRQHLLRDSQRTCLGLRIVYQSLRLYLSMRLEIMTPWHSSLSLHTSQTLYFLCPRVSNHSKMMVEHYSMCLDFSKVF